MSIEESIRSIHNALNKLGTTIENDYSVSEDFDYLRSSEPIPILCNESFEFEESIIRQKGDDNELAILLEQERKRCEELEKEINRKNQLIDEMKDLQNELFANFEQQNNSYSLKESGYKALEERYTQRLEFADLQCWLLNREIIELNSKVEQNHLEEEKYLAQISDLKMNLEFKNIEILRLKTENEEWKCNKNDEIALKNENLRLVKKIDGLYKTVAEKERDIEIIKEVKNEFENKILKWQSGLENIKKNLEKLEKHWEEIYDALCDRECAKMNSAIAEIRSSIDEFEQSDSEFSMESLSHSEDSLTHKTILEMEQGQIIDLYKKLKNLMVQFLPEGTSMEDLTPSRIWKWLIVIFEEHMELKMSLEGNFVEKLFKTLKVKSAKSAMRIIENFLKKL
ncbi:unnamed protein product [Blepharisma stoltei]|uniref:Uncharacterized protein n=1 Tax=Blepharisma stoltei TaxID=1481888 RepID=A0AAU9JH77_9CILI|nr:unnamed protein product [Blepharisma stoltei]